MKLWFLALDRKHLGDMSLLVGMVSCAFCVSLFILFFLFSDLSRLVPEQGPLRSVLGVIILLPGFIVWIGGLVGAMLLEWLISPIAVIIGLCALFQKEQKILISIVGIALNISIFCLCFWLFNKTSIGL